MYPGGHGRRGVAQAGTLPLARVSSVQSQSSLWCVVPLSESLATASICPGGHARGGVTQAGTPPRKRATLGCAGIGVE